MTKPQLIHEKIELMNGEILHASYSMTIDWPNIDKETKNQIENMQDVTFYQEKGSIYHLEIET